MAELKNIRIAISGIYDYAFEELPSLQLPLPGRGAPSWVEKKHIYKVYRPATVLMTACDKFKMLPLTHHHPKEIVDGSNFRKLALGYTGENPFVDYLDGKDEVGIRNTLLIYDDEALNAYDNGEVQLSPGYIASFEWKAGTTKKGQNYDIVMTEIKEVNHLALLPAGRGGSDAVIMDKAAERETVFDLVQEIEDARRIYKNDISNMKIACPEVTDSSIGPSNKGVGGQIRRQTGNCKYILLGNKENYKSIFDLVSAPVTTSIFDLVK